METPPPSLQVASPGGIRILGHQAPEGLSTKRLCINSLTVHPRQPEPCETFFDVEYMPVPCAPSLPPTGTRPRTAQHVQLLQQQLRAPSSAPTSLSQSGFRLTNGRQRFRNSEAEELSAVSFPQLAKGSIVVDICSHRQAFVLGASRTHCKVRFEALDGTWPQEGEPRVEFVPRERLRQLSDCWNSGVVAPALKTISRPPLPLQRTHAEAVAAAEAANCIGKLDHIVATPLSLLACVAAPQALLPKPGRAPTVEITARQQAFKPNSPASNISGRKTMSAVDDMTEEDVLLNRFRKVATSRYAGSIGAAWRIAIDHRGANRVGFQEFVRGGRVLGFTGNYRKLWATLTDGCSPEEGYVSLKDLDAESAAVLEDFKKYFTGLGLTLEDIWERHFDRDGSGRCSRDEFIHVMMRVGWSKKRAKYLFKILDVGMQQDISLDEIEDVGFDRRLFDEGPPQIEVTRMREKEGKDRAFRDFHGYVVRIFGNLVRGWRVGLDIDGDGKLSFREFCSACKNLGFREKLLSLWRFLDKANKGYITLQDVYPEAYAALEKFREVLEHDFRTLEDVWERVFDPDRSGRCTMVEFMNGCKEKLLYQGNAANIFRWLDVHNRKDLTIDDMEFVGMRRRVMSSPTAKQKILERQRSDRAEAEGMLRKFKSFVTHHFGSVVHAWRLCLDPDGDGKLQFTEFCARCRQIHFQGNLKALWMALDTDDQGHICLEDLDPNAVHGFEDFHRLATIFFDDLDSLWHCCLDPDGSGRCSLDEFRQGCRRLRYHKNVQQLFKHLDLRLEGAINMEMLEFFNFPRASSREASVRHKHENGSRSKTALVDFLSYEFKGCIVLAWRRSFCQGSPEQHLFEEVNAEDFFASCRTLGFKGNFLALWTELVPHRNRSSEQSSEASPGSPPSTRSSCMFKNFLVPMSSIESENNGDSSNTEDESEKKLKEKKKAAFFARNPFAQVAYLGYATLADLDPQSFGEIQSFRKLCQDQCKTTEGTWRKILQHCVEPNFDARIREVQFAYAARQMGFQGDANLTFRALDLQSQQMISFEALRFLQIGDDE